MTGYGVGRAPLGDGHAVVEVRSVNHRYLDVRVKAPPELTEAGAKIEAAARQQLGRGRYDVALRLEGAALGAAELNLPRARRVMRMLRELRDEVAPDADVPLTLLGQVPEVFEAPTADRTKAETAAVGAFGDALRHLDEMRNREGGTLELDLAQHLERVRQLGDRLSAAAPVAVKNAATRLKSRVTSLLASAHATLDDGRLATEIAVLADRSDIDEELVRLTSHIEQFALIANEQQPSGRRLDFLLQEMTREANTVGAKCQDAAMAHMVVELKAELEKMREQVQNVE